MYAVTFKEAVEDSVMMIGTLLINYAPATGLFDSRSTHTFIAKIFIDRIVVFVDDLGYDLLVSTTTGGILTTGSCVRGVSMLI